MGFTSHAQTGYWTDGRLHTGDQVGVEIRPGCSTRLHHWPDAWSLGLRAWLHNAARLRQPHGSNASLQPVRGWNPFMG